MDRSSSLQKKVIFALDVPTLEEARRFVGLLQDRVGLFKVGLELYSAFGPEAVKAVFEKGGRVFLDLEAIEELTRAPCQLVLFCQSSISTRSRVAFSLCGKFVIHRLVFVAKPELDSALLCLQVNFAFPFADRVQGPAFECLRMIAPNLDIASDGF